MHSTVPQSTRYILFAVGAAFGSALGLVTGAILMLWLGEGATRLFRRLLRRFPRDDEHPDFRLLLQ
jgi:hypothetical protein